MTEPVLQVAVSDGIATLTLNRPAVRNALDVALVDALREAFDALHERAGDDVRAVVMTGAGPTFCAGGDLRAMRQLREETPPESRARLQRAHRMLTALMTLELPVVAAVNGAAAGAGCNLALACDFVLAARDARFAQSFAKVGLIPDYGGLFTLPRIVGIQAAKELMFTGRTLDAEQARAMGLVYSVHEPDRLLDDALAFAGRFRDASPAAIGATKLALLDSLTTGLAGALDLEAHAQSVVRNGRYHREAVDRFLSKEPPRFDWDRDETG